MRVGAASWQESCPRPWSACAPDMPPIRGIAWPLSGPRSAPAAMKWARMWPSPSSTLSPAAPSYGETTSFPDGPSPPEPSLPKTPLTPDECWTCRLPAAVNWKPRGSLTETSSATRLVLPVIGMSFILTEPKEGVREECWLPLARFVEPPRSDSRGSGFTMHGATWWALPAAGGPKQGLVFQPMLTRMMRSLPVSPLPPSPPDLKCAPWIRNTFWWWTTTPIFWP